MGETVTEKGGMLAPWLQRVVVTLGVLALYRLGCGIPLPGTGPIWEWAARGDPDTPRRLVKASLFGLGVMPYPYCPKTRSAYL